MPGGKFLVVKPQTDESSDTQGNSQTTGNSWNKGVSGKLIAIVTGWTLVFDHSLALKKDGTVWTWERNA